MLLKELSEAIGVSGDEGAVRQILQQAIQPHVSDSTVDSIGNLTAVQRGTADQPLRVMLAAHMDEVGFMITGYESSGLLRFTSVGGIDDRILPGLRVEIGRQRVPGVVLWTPIHKNRETSVRAIKDLRIDIGVTSKGAAEATVKRGDRATFASAYLELSPTMRRGKAFDDRAGCALLVDVLAGGPYPVDVLAAFTVQEEIGLRGAQVAAQRLKPDVAFALEGTTAHDVPDPLADPDDPTRPNPACRIDGGPVLTVMDRSLITPPQLVRFLRRTAEAEEIPYQLKTALGGGTDAGSIHKAAGGIPAAVIALPCRYIHSPAAYLSTADYARTLALIQAALRRITPAAIQPL